MCQFGALVHSSVHYGNYSSHPSLYSQPCLYTQLLQRGQPYGVLLAGSHSPLIHRHV